MFNTHFPLPNRAYLGPCYLTMPTTQHDVIDTRSGHVALPSAAHAAALSAAQAFNRGWSPPPFKVFPAGTYRTGTRVLTAAEVLAFTGDEDQVPFCVLTAEGKQAIADWLGANARAAQAVQAWYHQAEEAAEEVGPREPAVIELEAEVSASGKPETMIIHPRYLQWMVRA